MAQLPPEQQQGVLASLSEQRRSDVITELSGWLPTCKPAVTEQTLSQAHLIDPELVLTTRDAGTVRAFWGTEPARAVGPS